jgi:exo-beta-1,3-glucanase (GH17 family)/cellulose synthase/poly-beta-1,6-N-acetylglucosamine synthase-like glycosyltransferase
MQKSTIVIVIMVALANLALWAFLNRPQAAPDWTGTIQGVSFSPFQRGQDPLAGKFPTSAEIEKDILLLKGQVAKLRTYSSSDGMEEVPALAEKHGLEVTAGAWLDRNREKNAQEIANLVENAGKFANIDRLMVGNEVILRQDLTVAEMAEYLAEVRASTSLPVGTAEPWHIWLKHPQLAESVDFIAVHLLPYWEGVADDEALGWSLEKFERVRQAFPDKPVIIGEIGWPSDGGAWDDADPSRVGQARFVREFLGIAQSRNLDYYIIEAFDQPWKETSEGGVGQYWGLFDADRQAKFPMRGGIVEIPRWPLQYLGALLLALVPMGIFLAHWQNIRQRGRLFFAALLQLAASVLVWTACVPVNNDLGSASLLLWGILLPAQGLLLAVVLINGLEMVELLWVRSWRRRFLPVRAERKQPFPKVSIHLAIYNEPPELVRQTLNGLASLDYPDFEILVIDNNTVREEVWKPVEAHCALLGPRFRFFHLPNWPGYKAGALNFALTQTAADAQIVGVIDSDYVVKPDWLRSLAPYFDRPEVGFVQAPQDNREWQDDAFKEMINWEYNGFFQIGMVHRNERNAIIQHGTMTLIRRSALEQVGNWGEWCICEDAELGLRLFQQGYEGVYVNHNFGAGDTPDSFAAYKGQRFRWTYGAVQILRRHWRSLTPWSRSGLTAGQRFHFLTGWLPWFSDALHLVFTFLGVLWTVGMLAWPKQFNFPPAMFLLPLFALFVFKIAHAYVLYRSRVNCTFFQRIGASIAGMGLTHIIGRAVFKALFHRRLGFLRTPKGENKPALIKGFLMAREESGMLLMLLVTQLSVVCRFGIDDLNSVLWLALLAIQALPYAAALFTSMASSFPRLRAPLRTGLLFRRALRYGLAPVRDLRFRAGRVPENEVR